MTLTRKQIFIRPTRHGLLFLTILGAMMAGSINYNNNAGFILVFLLGGMALISLFYSLHNLAGMDFTFVSARPVFAGQTAAFTIQVHAKNRQRVAVHIALPEQAGLWTTIPKNGTKTLEIPTKTTTRGICSPGPLGVSSVFPFGFFRLGAGLCVHMTCLVYPLPVKGSAVSGPGGGGIGGSAETQAAGPDDFQGLSLYQPGHDVGRIAWKAVSRGHGIFVKDFTAKADRFIMLDFDALHSRDTEYRLSRLCGMLLAADRQKQTYGVKLPGILIEPGSGQAHKQKCLRALALYNPKKEAS
ncbi:MAG: DUF58 domain-containing protein [Desulfotignum sp.]|nr:DUF58 domain-containing protein [Desulfobacteraceae bacterium]